MNDDHETHHFLRGTSQLADDVFDIFSQFIDTESKKKIRACSRRLKNLITFTKIEVNRFVKSYFTTRKHELIDQVKLMFQKIRNIDGKFPCYPYFIYACCDCHEYLPLNKNAKFFKNRHHEGEEGMLFPENLKFLRDIQVTGDSDLTVAAQLRE